MSIHYEVIVVDEKLAVGSFDFCWLKLPTESNEADY